MTYYKIKHPRRNDQGENRTKKSVFYRMDGIFCERLSTEGKGWIASNANKKRLKHWLEYTPEKAVEIQPEDIFVEMI